MRLLLDTHSFYWFTAGDRRLSQRAIDLIEADENDAFVSVASLWEMAIKVGKGKWPEAAWLVDNFESELAAGEFGMIAITTGHVRSAGLMQVSHADPFDRLLAAQATAETMTIVTIDPQMPKLGPACIW